MPGNEWFLSLKNYTKNKHSNMQYFMYNPHNTRSQFNNCWLSIISHVTVHKRCSERLPPELMHAWTRLIMDFSTLSEIPGRFQMVWQA